MFRPRSRPASDLSRVPAKKPEAPEEAKRRIRAAKAQRRLLMKVLGLKHQNELEPYFEAANRHFDRDETGKRMIRRDGSVSELALILGKSEATVSRWLKEADEQFDELRAIFSRFRTN